MKKGIESLVATVLIIGFTIVLAALVMRWTGILFTTTTENTGSQSEIAVTCVSDIKISVQDSCIEGNKVKLLIKNEGGQNINSFIVQSLSAKETQTTKIVTGLLTFASNNFLVNYTSTFLTIPNEIERIRIFPKVLFNGKTETCTETNYIPSNLRTCVDDDTVAYYSFDGHTRDESGNNNNGNIIGTPSYEEGTLGNSLHFTSDSQYVEVPYDLSLDVGDGVISDDFTYEAWIYLDRDVIPGEIMSIVDRYNLDPNPAFTTDTIDFYVVEDTGVNKVLFLAEYLSPQYIASSTNINTGEWNYISATFDGTKLRMYINGRLDNELDSTGPLIYTGEDLTIGGVPEYPLLTNFEGRIDEVRISKIARTF